MNSKVTMGLSGLKASDLVAKSIHIESKMEGNPLFATPTPTLAEVTAAREELEIRISAAAMGDRSAIALRKDQELVLKTRLRKLANYVQIASNSESDVLSSGYDVRKKSESITHLSRPTSLEAKRSDAEGVVDLSWKPVRGSQHYIVEMTTTDPLMGNTTWIHSAYTGKSNHEVSNLSPGTYYWFRVRALGSQGQSPFSDPSVVMAA